MTPERTYLLNLNRRPDRLAASLTECVKACIAPTVFAALDGHLLPLPKEWGKAGSGAYGCSLSHRAILGECVKNNVASVLVLEDDVTFVKDYQTKFKAFMEEVPDDWNAVFLGGQHISPPVQVTKNVVRCMNTHRTHAYLLRGDYIKTLLTHWTSEVGHVDHIWGRHQQDEAVNLYAPAVWLAGQRPGKSDINHRQMGERFWKPRQILTQPKKPCGCISRERRAVRRPGDK